MTDFRSLLSNMRRPKLLIRAARFGVADYRRERDLSRLIDATPRATSETALPKLLSAEEELEYANEKYRTATVTLFNQSQQDELERLQSLIVPSMACAQALGIK